MSQQPHDQPDAPAPVVDDDLSEPWRRRHLPAPPARRRTRPNRLLLILAIAAAIWVLSLSLQQATSERAALPALEHLAAALTDIDALIALHDDAIEAEAATGAERLTLPGYPLPDVTVAMAAATPGGALDLAAFRGALLDQAARDLYLRGGDAFAPPDAQAGQDLGSTGGVRLLLAVLSAATHDRASILMLGSGIATLLAGAVMVARGAEWGRLQLPGFALLLGAALAAGATLAIRLLSAVLGIAPEGAVGEVYSDIVSAIAWGPLRNALVLAVAGLALLLTAPIAHRLEGPSGGAAEARSRRPGSWMRPSGTDDVDGSIDVNGDAR